MTGINFTACANGPKPDGTGSLLLPHDHYEKGGANLENVYAEWPPPFELNYRPLLKLEVYLGCFKCFHHSMTRTGVKDLIYSASYSLERLNVCVRKSLLFFFPKGR